MILKQTKAMEYKFKLTSVQQVQCKMLLWVITLWAIVSLTQLSVLGELCHRSTGSRTAWPSLLAFCFGYTCWKSSLA